MNPAVVQVTHTSVTVQVHEQENNYASENIGEVLLISLPVVTMISVMNMVMNTVQKLCYTIAYSIAYI